LFDEIDDPVQFANHAIGLILRNRNTGEARDALDGGEIDGHGRAPVVKFTFAIMAMPVLRNRQGAGFLARLN
jgi:hypothetical protein